MLTTDTTGTGTGTSTSPMDVSKSRIERSEGSSPVGSPPELDTSMSIASSCSSDIASDLSLQSDDITPINRISQVNLFYVNILFLMLALILLGSRLYRPRSRIYSRSLGLDLVYN